MGKKYFCDYCEKSFTYTVEARKKHNAGHSHIEAKRQYVQKLLTPLEKYNAEISKPKCARFFRNQHCQFGDSCHYSHLNSDELEQLRQRALNQQTKSKEAPSLDNFTFSEDVQYEGPLSYLLTPSHLKDHSMLPPSLQPFDINCDAEINYWG